MGTLHSMTGYGHGESEAGGLAFSCDVRSVNHRFCDVRVKLPREHVKFEPALVQRVRKRIGRGRIEVAVRADTSAASASVVRVDADLALRYRDSLRDLASTLGMPGPDLPLTAYTELDGVVTLQAPVANDDVEQAVIEAVVAALDAHATMRRAEGEALASDLVARLERITDRVDQLAEDATEQLPRLRDKLHERLQLLLGEVPVDVDRVLTEAAIIAERADVTEEIVRLRQHTEAFLGAIRGGGRVGRKLDFLAQEMLREANTVGSKAWEAPVSLLSIEIKSEIERIREQVQNVE